MKGKFCKLCVKPTMCQEGFGCKECDIYQRHLKDDELKLSKKVEVKIK